MIVLALVTLALSPWHGPSLPTATPGAAKYRLAVHGAPRQVVNLRATGLADGWIASFCTDKLCSPYAYQLTLDGRGNGEIEFQAIREGDSSPKKTHVVIQADGGAKAQLDVTSGQGI